MLHVASRVTGHENEYNLLILALCPKVDKTKTKLKAVKNQTPKTPTYCIVWRECGLKYMFILRHHIYV